MISADFFWFIFEKTGSVAAYLLYRQLSGARI
ncbi:MAG: YqzL family protein [Bacillota bacterium]|nr:YqzL family protein [Bacillota bacterium]HHU30229.1 YqzL family protein [Bacillota bacterium]